MNAPARALTTVVLALLTARRSAAAEPPAAPAEPPAAPAPAPHRCFVTSQFGLLGPVSLSVDGRRVAAEPTGFAFVYDLGCSVGVYRKLGVVALGRFGTLVEPKIVHDEARSFTEVAVGPELRFPQSEHAMYYVSLPVGYTRTLAGKDVGRAVREEYAAGNGVNVGLVGGYSIGWQHHSFEADVWIHARWVWLTHTAALVGSAAPPVAESYALRYIGFGGGIGYAYRF